VRDGRLIVLAPIGVKHSELDKIIKKHEKWINSKIEAQRSKAEMFSGLSDEDIKRLKLAAKDYFKETVAYYAKIMSADCSGVTVTSAKTRFGSCNSKKSICFSYRLMLYPEAAREYVVVHELAHTFEMNHSQRFYKIIESVLPDYKERKRLLK
jgi:predicted metal-dependent hydrolase